MMSLACDISVCIMCVYVFLFYCVYVFTALPDNGRCCPASIKGNNVQTSPIVSGIRCLNNVPEITALEREGSEAQSPRPKYFTQISY